MPRRWFHNCIVKPTSSWPCPLRIAAAADESTRREIATAIFIVGQFHVLGTKIQVSSVFRVVRVVSCNSWIVFFVFFQRLKRATNYTKDTNNTKYITGCVD